MCGAVSKDEGKAAVEEYNSHIKEIRRQHLDAVQAASDVPGVIGFLMLDYGFQSPRYGFRIFELCSLIIDATRSFPPAVTIDLSGSCLKDAMFQCCLRLVQS